MASQPIIVDENAYGQIGLVDERPEYPAEFVAFLQSQEMQAVDPTLDDDRATAISFYRGEPYGNEEDGRSQVVTRDVAEVVDYMTVSVLRTMVSGDRVVEFEAVDEADKAAVDQANEAVSQQFLRMQDGYRVLHDSLKAGLLEKTGAVKTFVEFQPSRREIEAYEPQIAEMQEDGIEILEAEPIQPASIDPETGLPTPTLYRVVIVTQTPSFPDVPIPNEELLVARDARSLEESIYYAHKLQKTVSDLRQMGFPVDEQTIQYGEAVSSTQLSDARDEGQRDDNGTWRDGPNRLCWLLEEYVRYDLNGDGIAELLRVQRVGTEIFTCEEIEFGLVDEWCPFPMQHRRVGQSLADKCMDIQLVRSILLRQSLDNLYLSNAPRTLIHENGIGDTTIDDLLSVRPAGIVRWTGNVAPAPMVTPFVAESSFQALEFMAGERESRTGITRMNQGLDQDALSKTATGQAMMQAAGQQIEEYVARNFAEFMGRIFRKKYKLMRMFGEPFPIIIDGKPVMADPSQWPEDVRVNVRVGLGSGRKEQRIQNRMLLLSLQEKAAQSDIPISNAMIFNSIDGLVRDLGLGTGTDYWPGPDTPEPEQGEDPAALKVKADAEIEAAKLEQQQRQSDIDAMLKQRQQEQDAALKQQQLEYDLQAKREKAALDEALARDRASFEADLAMQQQAFEEGLAERRFQFEQDMARSKAATADDSVLPKKRSGGDLDK